MGGRSRGYEAERELVRKLWRRGFAVVRGPASGAKVRKAVYPDVVAIKNRHVLVFEVKKRSRLESIYLDKEQVAKLREFARRAGGDAFIAIKISGMPWRFVSVERLVDTGGSYKVSHEEIEKGLSFNDLMALVETTIPLTEFANKNGGRDEASTRA